MLSDEEKKAIDKLKRSANYFVMPIYEAKIILNLIEKQSKEIEELKYRNEESDIKLTKEQKENAIKYLRNYKDSLNEKAFKEKNIYVFEQLIQHVSNIIDIIYRLED